MIDEIPLALSAAQVEAVIRGNLPSAGGAAFAVEEVRPGYARIRLKYNKWMLRPGDLVSGPALFTAADADTLVHSSELSLLAQLNGTPAIGTADLLFGT